MFRSCALGKIFDRWPRWLGRVSHTAVVSLLVVSLLAATSSRLCLAHASPPDPTWILGLYDNGDVDAVVAFIVELSAVAGPSSPLPAAAFRPRQMILPEAPVAVHALYCEISDRAPPLD